MIISSIPLPKKIFTKEAMTIPISPINNRLPILVKSVFVVYPATAIIPNVTELMKNVVAIEDVEYTENMVLKLMPVRVE